MNANIFSGKIEMTKREAAEANEIPEVKITSKVVIKK